MNPSKIININYLLVKELDANTAKSCLYAMLLNYKGNLVAIEETLYTLQTINLIDMVCKHLKNCNNHDGLKEGIDFFNKHLTDIWAYYVDGKIYNGIN